MAHDLSALIEELQRRWRAQDIDPAPGNSPEAIRDFERRENVTLPADVVQYFLAVDGMGPLDALGAADVVPTDEDYIRFWSLAEVQAASKELPDEDASVLDGYFVFADFLVHSHAYAVRTTGEVAVLGGGMPIPIAASFTQFLAKYLFERDAFFP